MRVIPNWKASTYGRCKGWGETLIQDSSPVQALHEREFLELSHALEPLLWTCTEELKAKSVKRFNEEREYNQGQEYWSFQSCTMHMLK